MARTPKIVEDRREQILDAAMRVFAEKGFTRTTNKDIASEAGITAGLIYHYFESKEAVFKAIIEQRSPLSIIRQLPAEILAQPPAIFLPFLAQQVLGIVEGEPFVQILRMILPEIIHNPKLTPVGNELIQKVSAFLASYFEAQMHEGNLRQADPVLVAHMFMGNIMSFILRRQILRDAAFLHYTHEQIANTVTETMLQGLLPH
jgi:AcrR family transcriptional regulator